MIYQVNLQNQFNQYNISSLSYNIISYIYRISYDRYTIKNHRVPFINDRISYSILMNTHTRSTARRTSAELLDDLKCVCFLGGGKSS